MKHLNTIILAAYLLTPPAIFAASRGHATPTPSPTPIIVQTPTPAPSNGEAFSFTCVNCTTKEQASITHATAIIMQVRASKCFHDFMVGRTLSATNGLTNEQVVTLIKNWSQVAAVPLKFYSPTLFQSKGVIGYTYPNDPTIYLNRSYRAKYVWSDFAEASNEFHELLHKMGFTHPMACSGGQCDSYVPYSGNRAMEACTPGDVIQP